MALASATITVTTTAAAIPVSGSTGILGIYAPTPLTNPVYIGGSNVTSSNGIPLTAGSMTWFTNDSGSPAANAGW